MASTGRSALGARQLVFSELGRRKTGCCIEPPWPITTTIVYPAKKLGLVKFVPAIDRPLHMWFAKGGKHIVIVTWLHCRVRKCVAGRILPGQVEFCAQTWPRTGQVIQCNNHVGDEAPAMRQDCMLAADAVVSSKVGQGTDL